MIKRKSLLTSPMVDLKPKNEILVNFEFKRWSFKIRLLLRWFKIDVELYHNRQNRFVGNINAIFLPRNTNFAPGNPNMFLPYVLPNP